jgi:membrane-associated phospholipid phosphatase
MAELSAVKFWEAGATVRWDRMATDLYRLRGGSPGRALAYLGLAQYRAALAAEDGKQGPMHPSTAAAVAGASVVVLKQFYPLDGATIDAELAEQASAPGWPGERHTDFSAGEAIGRAVGAAVLVWAASDNVNVLSPGAPPVGPGYWVSSGSPLVRGMYGARPFFLAAQAELRSPPPPAFGSASFLAALAEVRAFSDSRTPEQVAISQKWAPFGGPLWHDLARELIVKHRRSEVEAARIMAYASTASFDAIIGCFDTKFAYWFLRPTHADPAITTAVPLPNHPSYPSAHSCENGAYLEVLAEAFPSERPLLEATAEEASMSRVIGGLHYLFDADAGVAIGRQAGWLALARRGLEQ